ncbi:MAG: 50S ribosomal protein L5 [Candidatus Odinarchaeia archaeon]
MSDTAILEVWDKNPMRRPRLYAVTVNIGVGSGGEKLEKALQVLEDITGQKPTPVKAKKHIRDWNVRKGERIACKVTLRGEKAREFLEKALKVVGNKLKASSFDDYGNVSFGIEEHIEIPGVSYEPELGIFGMDICITLERPGFRVKRRRIAKRKIPKRHRVTKEEAMLFLKEEFGIEIV